MNTTHHPSPTTDDPTPSATTRGYLIGVAVAVALIIVGVIVFLALRPNGDGDRDLRDHQTACLADGRPLSECMSISD